MWKKLSDMIVLRPFIVLLPVYFISRLYRLNLLPIFTDEAIYIYWAKLIQTSHTQFFISIADGKPPLLNWIIALLLQVLPESWYLLAGRLPSVFFGALTLIAIFKLSHLLFNSRTVSFLASLFYIFVPFCLFYDRMALYDSMLSSMLAWSAYFALKTVMTNSFRDALFFGGFLGLAFLSKPTAVLYLAFLPLLSLLFINRKNKPIKTLILLFIAAIIAEIFNNSLRVSSAYFMMAQKNQQFQQPLAEILKNPAEKIGGNLKGIFSWIIPYYTIPVFIAGILSFTVLLFKKFKIFLFLFILWIGPILAFAVFGREIFPRYFLFVTPYFLIATAYGINYLSQVIDKKIKIPYRISVTVIALMLLIVPVNFDYFLYADPPKAPFPRTDFNQYVGDHPSGYGLETIFNVIDKTIVKQKAVLIIQGTFGLYPYVFELRYWGDHRVKILPQWPLDSNNVKITKDIKGAKYFLIMKDFEQKPFPFPYPIIAVGEKPGGRFPIILSEF